MWSYLFACQVVSVSWVSGVGNLLQDILQYWYFRLLEGEREQQRRVPRWPAKVHPPVAHAHVLVSSGDRRAVRGAHRSGNLVRGAGMLSRCAGAAATPTAHKTRLDTHIVGGGFCTLDLSDCRRVIDRNKRHNGACPTARRVSNPLDTGYGGGSLIDKSSLC